MANRDGDLARKHVDYQKETAEKANLHEFTNKHMESTRTNGQ